MVRQLNRAVIPTENQVIHVNCNIEPQWYICSVCCWTNSNRHCLLFQLNCGLSHLKFDVSKMKRLDDTRFPPSHPPNMSTRSPINVVECPLNPSKKRKSRKEIHKNGSNWLEETKSKEILAFLFLVRFSYSAEDRQTLLVASMSTFPYWIREDRPDCAFRYIRQRESMHYRRQSCCENAEPNNTQTTMIW